ncbi:MAG: FAD-binding oxidoreductase [Rhodopseudomonas sp.]|uniref:NAD(P)/FAD-dependent oxidoreductase n=1 Tax=Rhodopseudomonas sp. TaxID=1078 RepID=UPI0017FA3C24|nr:FAD-binding oxidoreductase [Rhodopseudomonas sp.]NVN84717.1 FAD-binding oxidoreductase [Rhodopseudomonas sp.]
MTQPATSATKGPDDAPAPTPAGAVGFAIPHRDRLSFNLDVDICVIGAGLAGLTVALEAARMGASVAVLEARQVGWNASGHQIGTVMPGFGVPIGDLIARIGFHDTRDLWSLAKLGMDYVRDLATEETMPGINLTQGALEVSNVDIGDRLIGRLQMLGEDFSTEVEGWQIDHVRDVLKTDRYFHAIHYPTAFQLDGRKYLRGLEALARQAGVRIFEDTPAVSIDPSGIRKRIVTPEARLRASDIVLAGNVHLGAPLQRLSDTLLPVWRYAALTQPLGARLAEAISFAGSVTDTDGIDHYRIVDGDRLLWSSPETTWAAQPKRLGGAIRRRIRTVFPQLGAVEIDQIWSGVVGQTVHGMPQVGQLRRGLWVASGFGRQGLNTTAMAGQLIAQAIMHGDERWRLFSPFELVWAGGRTGRIAGQAISTAVRAGASAAGLLARYRERAAAREAIHEARLEAAKQNARQARPPRPPKPALADQPAAAEPHETTPAQ